MMALRRFITVFFTLATFVIVIVHCTKVEKKDSRGSAYAGSATCTNCHKHIQESYFHHAHAKASSIISHPNGIDSLAVPEGEFIFNENTKVGIERRDSGLYQVAYVNGHNKKAEHTDIVFGAGKSAYTFAFWYGNKLMQMPLNYLTKEHQWVNSPGFPTDQIYFGRPIIARCLACHSSYIEMKLVQTANFHLEEEFVKGSLIAGIDCERCHGPAAKHVAFHQSYPAVKKAAHMVNYRSLPLSRRVDLCGVCHSGTALQTLASTFTFKPGDTLKTLPQYDAHIGQDADVHGKQKQLLEASACYKMGKAECITCHDAHSGRKLSMEIYAQKCISCHQGVQHKKVKAVLSKNCIDCHMPVKTSEDIGFQKSNSKEKIPYTLRTHRIAVYEDLLKPKMK